MPFRFAACLSCAFGLITIAASRCPAADEPSAPNAEFAAGIERETKIIERYLSLLERNPREGTTLDRAYGLYVEQGRIDELVGRYRSRVKADETDGTAWMILGLIESRRGHDAEAIKAFTQASEHRPDDPLAPYYLGRALSIAGRPERAIAAMEESISRKPVRSDLPAIFVALGRLQGRFGNNEEAGKVWDRLEAAFPGDSRVKAEIATVLENEGRLELALQRYAKLAENADDEYRQVTYALTVAELKVRLSKPDEAIADYEALLDDLNPDNWLYREVRRGIENVYLRTDDRDGLASYYEDWIETHPEDVRAMSRLASILARLGRAEDARTWFDKAVRLAPSDTRLRRAYIRSLRRGGKTEAALQQFEALSKEMPNDSDVIRDWGTVYLEDESLSEEEREAKAAEIWKRLLADGDDDPVVTAQVADWFRQAGMTDEALSLYAKAVEQAPDDPRYLEYLGEYQHQLGQSEEAVATWKKLAAGENRTRANLVRLADVLSGFGYTEEAIAVFREADEMNLEFAARLRFAELLSEQEQYDKALDQIVKAQSLAESDEERQKALLDRIKTDRTAGRLEDRIAELRTQSEENPSAQASLTLALYLDASRDAAGGIDAARRAVKLDPGSIPAQATLARLADSAGQLTAAAAAFQKLAALDRRGRTEHLKRLAGLQRRLGQVDEALETGRAVLASSPGNPEAYSFYADLCFQAGRTEQGFDALRRAVRFAPDDPGPLLRLASALAEQFRTDEALELYWQAFEKAEAFDDKLPTVARLATLYLRTDRFQELIDRLNREARGEDRETKLLVAEAHQTVGNLGKAREALESLLTQSPRDTGLLGRLSALAEQNNDYETALRYQREIIELAPEDRAAKARLARLYLASDVDAGDEFWDSLVADDLDHVETIALIDAMLGAEKYDDALRLTNRGLREKPKDWELLYRRAFAMLKQETDHVEADKSMALLAMGNEQDKQARQDTPTTTFERLLALDLPDDTPAAKVAAQRKRTASFGSSMSMSGTLPSSYPYVLRRTQSVTRSQMAFGFRQQAQDAGMGMAMSSRRSTWTPTDYGSARLAAIGWLAHESPDCDFLTELEKAAKSDNASARTLWDRFYLVSYKSSGSSPSSGDVSKTDVLESARRLAELGDPGGAWLYLVQLAQHRRQTQVRSSSGQVTSSEPEPLDDEQLDLMVRCYEQIRSENSGPYSSYITTAVARELGRAGQKEKARAFVDEMLASTDNPQVLTSLLSASSGIKGAGIVDAVFKRLESLPPNKLSSVRGSGRQIAELMRAAWDEGNRDKTLKLLDRQLALAERRLEGTRSRSGSSRSSSSNYGIAIWKKNGAQNHVSVRGSEMNEYLGVDEMTVLLNAVQCFKEKEAIDALVAHLKKRAEAATGSKSAMSHLAVATVLQHANSDQSANAVGASPFGSTWVPQPSTSGESEDESWQVAAIEATRKAVVVAPDDYSLRLTLARKLIERGRKSEALTLLEEIEPFDPEHLKDRELLMLDIAPDLSQVDRARAAAKRLFGLRLDSDTQINLAKSMQQIGMASQAEAVMSRLRSGGGGLSTQYKLLLHYQQQDDMETAVEIARAIVRRTHGSTGGSRRTASDQYRKQAVEVLKQAGEIDGLIDRARQRAKAAPGSIKVQRQLAEYLSAAGKTAEAAAVLKKASKNRPDDADLKFQLAGRIIAMGKADDAVALYKAALEAKPQLMNQDFYEMRQAFEKADRTAEFLKLLGEIDYSQGVRISYAANTASNKFREDEYKDEALELFDAILSANPDQRADVFQSVRTDEAWENPMIVGHALALLKEDGTSLTWQSLGNSSSFSPGGKIRTLFNSFSKAAQSDARKKEFQTAITEMATNNPKWQPGQALLAIVEASQGKHESSRQRIRKLLDNEQSSIPDRAAWGLAVELSEYEALHDPAIELLEQAIAGDVRLSTSFEYQPEALLVEIYAKAGEKQKAREIILTKGMVLPDQNYGNPKYEAYQEISHFIDVGDKLVELGFPIDALRIYDRHAADPRRIEAAREYNAEYTARQIKQGREKALKQIKPANVATFLEAAAKEKSAEGTPSLDLILTVTGSKLPEKRIDSVIVTAVKKALDSDGEKKGDADATQSILSNIETLAKNRPDDRSVQILQTVAAYSQHDLDAATEATKQLITLDEAAASGKKEKQPKKSATMGRLGLWMVAREAARHDDTWDLAKELGDRALEAAKSLPEDRWATALLRERAQMALEADDRPAAKENLTNALNLIIPPRTSEKENGKAAPREAPKPNRAAEQKTSKTSSTGGTTAIVPASAPTFRTRPGAVFGGAVKIQLTSQNQTSTTADSSRRVVSLEQAKQALELADLAAENGMQELSFKAVRRSLAGGRPLKIELPNQGGTAAIGGGLSAASQKVMEIDREVAKRLTKIGNAWWRKKVDPNAVYDVLVATLLPADRPDQTLIYAPPLNKQHADAPKSAARMLVNWAGRAGKLDDLAERLDQRRAGTARGISLNVLRVLTAYKAGEMDAAKTALSSIEKDLSGSPSTRYAEFACHAALPGLSRNKVRSAAGQVLTRAVAKYAAYGSNSPLDWLSFKLAEHNFRHDRPEAAVKLLDDYLAALSRIYANYTGGYDTFRRRKALLRISQTLSRFGRPNAALDRLGEALELPVLSRYGGSNSLDYLFLSGLSRRLAADSSRQTYDHLKSWTLPSDKRKSVWLLSAIAPAMAPPAEFGIPRDPAKTAFGPDRLGVVTGTAVALIELAKRHGDLAALTAEVDRLAEAEVENAVELSILLHAAAGTGAEVAEEFETIVKDYEKKKASQTRFGNQLYPMMLLLAEAAAADPALRPNAEQLLGKIEKFSRNKDGQFRAAARLIAVECAALDAGLAPAEVLLRNDFGSWAVGRVPRRADFQKPRISALWAVREGVARHLAGSQIDPLVFRYPLTGSFDIVVKAYDGNWGESQVGYGGLFYEPYAWSQKAKVYDVGGFSNKDISFPGLRQGDYNTFRIEVRPDSTRGLVIGKELHTDKQPSTASPFLMLNAVFGRNTAFRDVRIEGNPVIPREVHLVDGNRLDGWSGHMRGDVKPQRPGIEEFDTQRGGKPTWTATDGVVTAHRKPDSAPRQSLFSYRRPLAGGESIEYEFRLDKGDGPVHPALGRLAFLLKPGGVRLHWLVPENNPAWTGLGPHNAIEAPEYRRGPKQLFLKEGDWNRVRLSLAASLVRVELNGELVLERPLGETESRVFGLFRYAGKPAKIRNIILRGDWPKQLDEETKTGLLAAAPASNDSQLIRFERAIITEKHLRRPVWPRLDSLSVLPPPKRFTKLLAWVLPSDTNPGWALGGAFSPANPPPGNDNFGVEPAPETPRGHVGGRIVSAAQLLVKTAAEIDKLDALASKIDAAPAKSDADRRSRGALKCLIAIERGELAAAAEKLNAFLPILRTVPVSASEHERWPEVLAAGAALDHPDLSDEAVALLDYIVSQQIQKDASDATGPIWRRHVRRLRGEAQALAETGLSRAELSAAPPLEYWRSATHEQAVHRGTGEPRPLWQLRPNGEIWHRGGPHWQFLYLTVPLRGDFEVAGEFQTFAWREVHTRVAGLGTPPRFDHENYNLMRYGRNEQITPLSKSITYGDWHSHRAAVKDGVYTSWINGVKVHEQKVSESFDPWVALAAHGIMNGGVRNLTITGSPTIPDEINLLRAKDLAGWRLYYPGDFTSKSRDWRRRGDEIVGPKRRSKAINQSVLFYHRPMFEDGEIRYDFYYEPNKTLVHPALDRRVFLLAPAGVKVRWLTDARYDRTGVSLKNAIDEPGHRRGPNPIPLQANAWNTLALSLKGNVATISLNDQTIYQRPLESTNQRSFGLFRFADRTAARIRNVRYRGDWPKQLPSADQLFSAAEVIP